MTRVRLEDLPPAVREQAEVKLGIRTPEAPKRSKYGAKATWVDGWRFDSRAEARRYGELKALQAAGEIAYFLRQVPFHLPGTTLYRVDFLIVENDGRARYEDVKGVLTKECAMKLRQVRELYGVEVELVR